VAILLDCFCLVVVILVTVGQRDLNLLLSVHKWPIHCSLPALYLREGKNGAKNLLARPIDYNFRKVWLILMFLLMLSITGMALLMATLNAGQRPELEILSYQPWLIPLAFIGILLVVAGPV
jgi:hypothetical protein